MVADHRDILEGSTNKYQSWEVTDPERWVPHGYAVGLTQSGFAAQDLTDDELVKEHMRHMVGGRSPLAAGERVLQFVFPERPGALMRFLSSLLPAWNITMFHYRNQGSDDARVLVGLQAPNADEAAFRRVLDAVGYTYEELTSTPCYRLFLSPRK